MSFFEELKRRNVFRVGVAYAVAAWLLLQLTEVLTELLELPTSIGKIVIALLVIGFPLALFFAWAFEGHHRRAGPGDRRHGCRAVLVCRPARGNHRSDKTG